MSFVKVDAPPRPVVVISGPGGSGKTTIVQDLIANDDTLWFPRSWSTRKPRYGGEDEYRFVDEQRFQTMMDAGGFLEVAKVGHQHDGGYRVGAPVVHDRFTDKLLLLILTVDGWLQIRSQFPQNLTFWLDVPDIQLRRRMVRRGDKPALIARRMRLAREETDKAYRVGYSHIVKNHYGQYYDALSEIKAYIAAFR